MNSAVANYIMIFITKPLYSLPMIGGSDIGQDEDSAKMPPPPAKLGHIKKRKSKRAADFHTSVSVTKSAPVTPQERSPIKEEKHSDSDR